MNNVIAIIPARGGSKGIPNKNLKLIGGEPLLYWSIKAASLASCIKSVWVSSDSKKILDYAKTQGANSILRPAELATDQSSSECAWIHAIQHIKENDTSPDIIFGLQATSPLRQPKDLDKAYSYYIDKKLDSLFSANIFEDFNYWQMKDYSLKSINYNYKSRQRRQEIGGKLIHENGSFYIFTPQGIIKSKNRLDGHIGYYPMDKEKMFQIDAYDDIPICEALLSLHLFNDLKPLEG